MAWRKWIGFPVSFILAVTLGMPAMKTEASEQPVNLVRNKPVQTSSQASSTGPGTAAVDGDASTFWQPLAKDREDMNVWISADLGKAETFNTFTVSFRSVDMVSAVSALVSSDGTTWEEVASKKGNLTAQDKMRFKDTSARYVKLDITLSKNSNVNLFEWGVYRETGDGPGPNPEEPVIPSDLASVYFVKEDGQPYAVNEAIEMKKGESRTLSLSLKGKRKNGEIVDLSKYNKTLKTNTKFITVEQNGTVTALQAGASTVYTEVKVTKDLTLTTPDIWILVKDPNEFLAEALIANTSLVHPRMKTEIGQPAVLQLGDDFPAVSVQANVKLDVSGRVVRNGQPVAVIPKVAVNKSETKNVTLPFKANQSGSYEIRLTLQREGLPPAYDVFYFTVMDSAAIPDGQSSIAYTGPDGKLVYVPDYKGNRVIDFSNAGYMGGGVQLPDVQARVAVEPGEGDATARIQQAIDQVSQMPVGLDGFRGAVLLKKGRYEIEGTLYVRTSGVVLRGEGQDEGGTLLFGSGNKPRNLIEIGSSKGPVIDNASMTDVTDLYVPSGAKTFHVKDASAYKVGDKVIVRRIGNARFITEVGMDYIYKRPGGTVSQWGPFNLDFDRVITGINGNEITVDAALANSIELRWGGGQLYKYNDDERIEKIGVEKMRVDSAFDPSVIDTTMDNGKTDPYYADEKHTERFVMMNNMKNAWVRDVTGYHLAYALVQMGRHAKWVTVQDSKVFDMVSIITGGRRYAYYIQGQQNLVQRTYAETARHGYVVDSRVQGPNVFLEGESRIDYNTSEPHHRWSVGGLFDNIKSPIAIRDRAWLGSGHGWAGANYVTWNTEGKLTSQQPPTAQNYAIGHVGEKVPGFLPDTDYDTRPRKDAYWELHGRHVTPLSLYKQQLKERLGEQALQNIAYRPIGGGSLDTPIPQQSSQGN
ncbi:discoidin domain-containing protein [Paenibacillus elgii]